MLVFRVGHSGHRQTSERRKHVGCDERFDLDLMIAEEDGWLSAQSIEGVDAFNHDSIDVTIGERQDKLLTDPAVDDAMLGSPERLHCREHVWFRELDTGWPNDAYAHVGGLVDTNAVAPQRAGADHIGAPLVLADFDDLHHAGNQLVTRGDLTPVLPSQRSIEHQRLEVAPRLGHALVEHETLKQLDERLDAERTGLDRVLEEVCFEEPLVDIDVLLAAHDAEPCDTGARLMVYSIDHEQHRLSEPRSIAEVGRWSSREVDRLTFASAELGTMIVRYRQTHLVGESLRGEESEDGCHRVDEPVAKQALDVEPLDNHAASAGDVGDLDLRGEYASGASQFIDQRSGAVEVSEHQIFVEVGDRTDCRGHPAAGLQSCLEQHREGHGLGSVLVEVPGIVGDVVLAYDLHTGLTDIEFANDLSDPADEVIRRPGQTRRLPNTVEQLIHRPECFRGPSPGARDHGLPVELESIAVGCDRCWLNHALVQLRHRCQRPPGNKLNTDAMCMKRSLAVDITKHVADHRGVWTRPHLLNVQLVSHSFGTRIDLTTALQFERLFRQGLKSPPIASSRVAKRSEIERHRLDAGLDHEVARHTWVVLEMALEEPVVVLDRGLAAHETTPPQPACGIELADVIDKELRPSLNGWAAGVRLAPFVPGTETVEQSSFAECGYFAGRET